MERTDGYFQIVNSSAVLTGARGEVSMGLDADHRSLCNVDIRETSYTELCEQICKALQDARLEIAAESPECELGLRDALLMG